MHRMTVDERRARIAVRHRLAVAARSNDPVAIAQGMVALHATDPSTVFLSTAARMVTPSVQPLERALYDDRRLVRTLCMRRTMFVLPVSMVPVVQAACTDAHRWSPMSSWLPGTVTPPSPDEARVELSRQWLRAFGPATIADLKWWSGLTLGQVRTAVSALDVEEADLDGVPGLVLGDDVDPTPRPEPWIALLPSLDSTTMGWQQRAWYLGEHGKTLFDTNGNAGPAVWCDGRIVGGWAQRKTGEVVFRLLDDIGREAVAAIEVEASRLTEWLGDVRVTPRFPTPLQRQLAQGELGTSPRLA